MTPVAVDVIHLDADHDECMDVMLGASALRADHAGVRLNCDAVWISAAEAGQWGKQTYYRPAKVN
jgi:hypothetical protein